ncbi:MAG TPA: patatin-like phospholipase family protein [Draconibacterium sp.]|nr:patatin-like phospholipase family protein [Draconibacterium sp.]
MKIQILKNKPARVVLVAVFFVFVFSISFSQNQDSTLTRPKIGLVLSGGGAKGFAHIGVIKVLEEVGIRPDIITGTSMGSIMGGLYAVGYSAAELTEINNTADWNHLLTDKETLRKVSMEDKDESNKYIFEIPVKEKKIHLPSGLIEGQHLEDKFSELFWPLTVDQNFDSLPIPFHCMAVDVVSGKVVEHKSGDIVRAIRSSMAIPTVFAPVKMDSMLLVDGGVTRNFPVQEAINMGADIIIGVYVGFPEDITADDLNSMTAVLSRSIALAGIVDAREQNQKVDILIVPKLGKYGSSDFTSGPIIQQLGEEAARGKYKELKALADSLNRTFTPVPKIKQPRKIKITDVRVEGLVSLDDAYIIWRSGIEKGDSISWQDIHNAIEYIHGSPFLMKLTYSLKYDDANKGYILTFHATENPRTTFKLAPRYDNQLGVGLVTNVTTRNLILPSSALLFTVNISQNPEFNLDIYRLLGEKQHFTNHFFANGYEYKLPLYASGEELGQYHLSFFETGYGAHYAPGLNHMLKIQGFYKYNKVKPMLDLKTIFPEAGFKNFVTKDLGYLVGYEINSLDDLYYPTKGIDLSVNFSHSLYSKSVMNEPLHGNDFTYFVNEREGSFATLKIDHNWYKTFGRSVTYHFGTGAGLNTSNPGINGKFLIGGHRYAGRMAYQNFIGYNFGELLYNNYLYATSGLDVRLIKGLYLSTMVNVGSFSDVLEDVFTSLKDKAIPEYVWGFGGAIKYDSVIGPVELLFAGNNQDSKFRFLLNVGFPF